MFFSFINLTIDNNSDYGVSTIKRLPVCYMTEQYEIFWWG